MALFRRDRDTDPADLLRHFNVNDAVRVRYNGKYHASRVEDIGPEGLWVAWPAVLGVPLRLAVDDEATVVSSVSAGMQGFRAKVAERREGPPAMLCLTLYDALGTVQRRDYARVPDTLPVRFRVLDMQSLKAGDTVATVSRNISGGGMLLAVQREDRPFAGDRLALEIGLPGADTVQCHGQVVWVDNVEDSHEVFEMAVRFTDIREQDRQAVIRRVYTRQAELHKSGLM